jgi:hypothetical protein
MGFISVVVLSEFQDGIGLPDLPATYQYQRFVGRVGFPIQHPLRDLPLHNWTTFWRIQIATKPTELLGNHATKPTERITAIMVMK